MVADDARSFFAKTSERYDLIIFGLLDSHTTGAMTNARLDHYVYTLEGIAEAKGLLKPGGVMTLTFEPNKLYIADRIHGTLESLFGQAPLAFRIPRSTYGWGGLMFVTGEDPYSAGPVRSAWPVTEKSAASVFRAASTACSTAVMLAEVSSALSKAK